MKASLKEFILTVAGFVYTGRMARALHSGKPRPLKDIPTWQIGWFTLNELSDSASAAAQMCYSECLRELRLRRLEQEEVTQAKPAGPHAGDNESNP